MRRPHDDGGHFVWEDAADDYAARVGTLWLERKA